MKNPLAPKNVAVRLVGSVGAPFVLYWAWGGWGLAAAVALEAIGLELLWQCKFMEKP